MSRRKSTRKLGRRRSLKSVKPRRRMNAKKAVRTDRGRLKGKGIGGAWR
jgi:hypothetical protein